MCRFWPSDRSFIPRANKKDAASLLRHAIIFCSQNLMLNVVTEAAQSPVNLIYGPPVVDTRYSGDILHHHKRGHQILNDPQIFPEKPGPLIMHSTLMVVYAERLTRRPAYKHVKLPARNPCHFQ